MAIVTVIMFASRKLLDIISRKEFTSAASYPTILWDYETSRRQWLWRLSSVRPHIKVAKGRKMFHRKSLSRAFDGCGSTATSMSNEKNATNDSYQLIKVIVLSTNCLINSILFSYLKSSHNETLGFFHHHVIEFTKKKFLAFLDT